MAGLDGTLSSAEASERLGVSMRQVQRLIASGTLTTAGLVGRTQLLDAASVHRLKIRGAGRGRPWEPETVAAAVEMLSDGETALLTSVARDRLRRRLSGMSAEHLVRASRNRSDLRRYRGSASFFERMRKRITPAALAAIQSDPGLARTFGLAGGGEMIVDGYVGEKTARQLVRDHHLVEDAAGNVLLRVTRLDSMLVVNVVVVALDLSESLDTRARSAGLSLLTKRLQSLR